MKQAKLIHIAVRSAEPRSLADFYKSAFGSKRCLATGGSGILTDGTMQLVLLNLGPDPVSGLYCYGLAANDSADETLQRLRDSRLAAAWEQTGWTKASGRFISVIP